MILIYNQKQSDEALGNYISMAHIAIDLSLSYEKLNDLAVKSKCLSIAKTLISDDSSFRANELKEWIKDIERKYEN